MTYSVRPATEADLDAVFGLVAQFATSFKPERTQYAASFAHILQQEDAHLLVAQQEERIIGYCLGFDHYTFYANGRVAWVEEIMVLPDFRRQRVGEMLMAAFEVWAKNRGSALVALATRRAASFYLALGYEESAAYFRKVL
jgi:GNAT superfamily N-acetyltransferase